MLTPIPDQLRDFFKSDIFQVEKVFEENYDYAISEFYKRFATEQDIAETKDRISVDINKLIE